MKIHTIKYQIGTYSGTITVTADNDAEHEHIIAKAKRRLRSKTSMPMCYESYKIIESKDITT